MFTLAFAIMLKVEPQLANALKEHVEPKLTKSNAESVERAPICTLEMREKLLPHFPIALILEEEAKLDHALVDMRCPVQHLELMERLEPSLATALRDRDEPKTDWSSAERLEPERTAP